MTRLQLRLFGGLEARVGSGPALRLPTRKAEALLAYLALPAGESHPRDKLAALLWGDRADAQARGSLRRALAELRKSLSGTTSLVVTGHTVSLAATVEVDVAEFARLVADGTPDALERAVALYRGELLEGLSLDEPPFEEWLLAERERLRELALEALGRLLAHQRQAELTEPAIRTALRLLALDPLQEAVHRTLMRLYARHGRRAAALKQYQLCVTALRRELGAEPEPETKQLYQELVPLRSSEPAKAEPARRHRRRAIVTRAEMTVVPEAPLIGRERERGRLRDALDEISNGRGQVVAMVGEAGIGKSSLLAGFAAEAEERGARVLLGRSHESEQILPFGPWVDAFRTGHVVDDEDMLSALGPFWRAELARLFPEAHTAGLPAATDDARQLFEAVAHLVAHLAERQPLVLLLEDVHWSDEMSLRLLAFLGRRIRSTSVMIVATVREEEMERAPALRSSLDELGRERHFVTVNLSPLSRDDTAMLVRALARAGSGDVSVTRLSERIWKVSEGNPFMVVETMRALEQGADVPAPAALPLPDRVRHVVARRLEGLSERGRHLVSVAAVIGREFEFALLQQAASLGEREAAEGLEELVRRRVLHGLGEGFEFTHERIREVAYRQLLGPRRKMLHAAVAVALETAYSANLEPHYAALATHYREGEVWEKAQRYLRHAGVQAATRSALQDARVWFEQALSAVEALPESRATLEQALDIRLELRSMLHQLAEMRLALECLHEAEALAERLNDDSRRARVHAFATSAHAMLGELDEAHASGTKALGIARRLGDLELRIITTTYLEQVHYYRGDYQRAIELATDNLAALPGEWVSRSFGPAAPASVYGVYDRIWLVVSLSQVGRFAEAAEHEAAAIRIAEPTQHAFTVGVAHWAAGTRHLLKGDWASARALLEHGIGVVRAGNVAILLYHTVACSACVLAQFHETADALSRVREAEQGFEGRGAAGQVGHLGWGYYMLGRASLLLGRLDEARRLGERALEYSPSHPGFAAHAFQLFGDIAIHADRDDAEASEDHYRKALALAEPRGMRPLVAHCHFGLGKVYRRTGTGDRATEHFCAAATMYREMDMAYWLEQAERESAPERRS